MVGLAVAFDTYNDSGNYISVHSCGAAPNNHFACQLGEIAFAPSIDDGNVHTVKIEYIPGTMRIFMDDLTNPDLIVSMDLAALVSLDDGEAWVGFTAATGSGGQENHDILSWSLCTGTGLAACYSFNEGSGTTALDSSGNGNHGTIYNGATYVPGVAGTALQFDGADDYVEVPHSASLNVGNQITVEFWLKTTLTDNWVSITKTDGCGATGWHFQHATHSPNVIGWGPAHGSCWTIAGPPSTTPITDGSWHHVVGTYDRTLGEIKTYVDGRLEGIASESEHQNLPLDNNEPLWFGQPKWASWAGQRYLGILDEIRIYNRVLSASDILARCQESAPPGVVCGTPSPNNPPIANAGPDQIVGVETTVALDGSASSDLDGDPLTYSWVFLSKPAGSGAALSNPTSVNPTFVADLKGDYVLELTVDDGQGGTDSDQIKITAVVKGDVDMNGVVNVIDARICLQSTLGLITLTSEQQDAADMDGDSDIDRDDCVKIAEKSIGINNTVVHRGLPVVSVLAALGLVAVGLPFLFSRWRTRRSLWMLIILLFGSTLLLTSCLGSSPLGGAPTALTIQFGVHTLTVHAQNMPGGGLASLEAKAGGFTFDPKKMEVLGLTPASGWDLLASQIDNTTGEVRFAVVNPTEGVTDGDVLTITIQRKGTSGSLRVHWDKTKLTLGDANNQEIPANQYQAIP